MVIMDPSEPELSLEDVFDHSDHKNDYYDHNDSLDGSWGFASVERRLDLNESLDLGKQEGRMRQVLEQMDIPVGESSFNSSSFQRDDTYLRKLPEERRDFRAVVDSFEEDLVEALDDVQAIGNFIQKWRIKTYRQQQHQIRLNERGYKANTDSADENVNVDDSAAEKLDSDLIAEDVDDGFAAEDADEEFAEENVDDELAEDDMDDGSVASDASSVEKNPKKAKKSKQEDDDNDSVASSIASDHSPVKEVKKKDKKRKTTTKKPKKDTKKKTKIKKSKRRDNDYDDASEASSIASQVSEENSIASEECSIVSEEGSIASEASSIASEPSITKKTKSKAKKAKMNTKTKKKKVKGEDDEESLDSTIESSDESEKPVRKPESEKFVRKTRRREPSCKRVRTVSHRRSIAPACTKRVKTDTLRKRSIVLAVFSKNENGGVSVRLRRRTSAKPEDSRMKRGKDLAAKKKKKRGSGRPKENVHKKRGKSKKLTMGESMDDTESTRPLTDEESVKLADTPLDVSFFDWAQWRYRKMIESCPTWFDWDKWLEEQRRQQPKTKKGVKKGKVQKSRRSKRTSVR